MNTQNKIKIELVKHPEKYTNKLKYESWGNGYLEISDEHFAYKYLVSCIDRYGYNRNICKEQITHSKLTKNGIEIGFDTLHLYNNKTHNKEWVLLKCNEIKDFLNSKEFITEIQIDLERYNRELIELLKTNK